MDFPNLVPAYCYIINGLADGATPSRRARGHPHASPSWPPVSADPQRKHHTSAGSTPLRGRTPKPRRGFVAAAASVIELYSAMTFFSEFLNKNRGME